MTMIVGAGLAGASRSARANGAFPSSQAVLLPAERPREIIVGTTFGLVFTDDDGATWRYACEADLTRQGRNYVVGPPPAHRIYGVSEQGAPVSSDGACSWSLGGGALVAPGAETLVYDVFPDRTNGARVFALAVPAAPVDPIGSAYRSLDGGLTYEGPLFSPPAQSTSTGIEASISSPDIVYLTWIERAGPRPHLAVSTDGGDTWASRDLGPALGSVVPSLMAVNPTDPSTLYLRLVSTAPDPAPFEAIAVTADGGASWSTPVVLTSGKLSGFVRLSDGTLFATGADSSGAYVLMRSDDGGITFATAPLDFRAVGLAERGGVLFAATDFAADGFALVSSSDRGLTWTPRLRFGNITGIKECVRSACLNDCANLANLTLFPGETCHASLSDGGAGTVPDAAGPGEMRDGCRCATAEAAADASDGLLALLLVGFASRRRR